MDLGIKKDKRATKYHQRGIRNGEISKTRKIAMSDITEECGEDKLYERNYAAIESIVMDYMKLELGIIRI